MALTGRTQAANEKIVEEAKAVFKEAVSVATPAERGATWQVLTNERAANIVSPIRQVLEKIDGKENPNKKMITLALGDPSAYPHLRPSEHMAQTLVKIITDASANGYGPAQGNVSARKAVAETYTLPNRPALTPKEVYMTWGCNEALRQCLTAFASEGANILLPCPGYPMYEILCQFLGVECRWYHLQPDKNWEVDLDQLRSLVDSKTSALLLNNPNNPCGSVYSREHLTAIMGVAEELKLPVIADEVYAGITFGDAEFVPCATITNRVPVLTVCSVSKRWLAPGWRLGWVAMYDVDGILASAGVNDILLKLCQMSLGPAGPMQAALASVLKDTPKEWYEQVRSDLEESGKCCVRRIRQIPGLETTEPEGAMYCMVKMVPGYFDEQVGGSAIDFAAQLLTEESLALLPGECFRAPFYFRVAFPASVEDLEEAFDRLEGFCQRHAATSSPSTSAGESLTTTIGSPESSP